MVRGWIGVAIQTVTPDLAKSFSMKKAEGALVSEVVPGGPAEKGGVKTGDIIVAFDGRSIKTANDLPRIVAETPVGKTVQVTVIRGGKELRLSIKVEEMTERKLAAQSAAPVQSFGMKVGDITSALRQQFGLGEKRGVIVTAVDSGGLADEAGIQAGDVIREVNRRDIRNLADYNAAMGKAGKGQPVLFLIKRGNQTFYVTIETS